MPEVVLCHAKPGNLATQRIPTSPGKVAQLLDKASNLASAPGERLVLTYQGHILSPSAALEVPKGGLVMITVLPPPPAAPAAPAPVKMTGDEIKRFTIAFGSALKHPAFNKVVRRLVQRDNMDSLAAACPGLSTDLVAQAFLTRPELLLHLIEPETLTKVGEEHPSILEAAHNLAAAVHEEQSQGAGKEEERSTGGSYYLDEMSDEEMEEDGGGAAGPSRGQARARSSNSFNSITPAQLAQALSAAAGGSGRGAAQGFQGFQGVTGLGPAAARSEAGGSSAPTSASPSARITSDMFQAAMLQAMAGTGMPGMGAGSGQPAAAPLAQAESAADFTEQVARMKEMGIVDEGLALRALQIMGGDLQAAVDLIFSGWEGGDEAMQ